MKIATTIGEMYAHTGSYTEAIEAYKDTGFRYLDFSFYTMVLKENIITYNGKEYEKNI